MSLTDSGRSARAYRPDIDGLRAIAIASVVFYHAGLLGVSGGFTGVDIFFVISGYLIGGHIYSDIQAGRFSFLDFYRLRARRILPAFFAMLGVVLIAGWFLLAPKELSDLAKSSFAATLSTSNIYFWKHTGYFDTQNQFNPLLMTWSLGIEEQFYAIIPVLMVLLSRFRRTLVLPAILAFCAVSFLAAWWQVAINPVVAFYLTPLRAWELGAGVALAVFEQRTLSVGRSFSWLNGRLSNVFSVLGVLLLLAPIFLLTADSLFPGPAALPSVFGAILLLAVPTSWINRRVLSFSPLVFCGRISYSWYLWHWPMLSFLRIVAGTHLQVPPAIAAVVLSFLAAVASYYVVEQPFRHSQRAALPLLVRYALLSLAFIAVGLFFWKSHGFPSRFPQLTHLENEISYQHYDPCLILNAGDTPKALPPCSDVPSSHAVVALWGDSHSAALAPALRKLVHKDGYDFLELSKSGCRPFDDPSSDPACRNFNRNVLRKLQSDPRVHIVVIADAWGHSFTPKFAAERLAAGNHNLDSPVDTAGGAQDARFQFLHDASASLQNLGRKVVVMEDVPGFLTDPAMVVRTSQIPLRRALARLLGIEVSSQSEFNSAPVMEEAESTDLQRMAADIPGLELVDLRHSFCATAGLCAYRSQGQMLYLDNNHLSPEGAEFALRNFQLP